MEHDLYCPLHPSYQGGWSATVPRRCSCRPAHATEESTGDPFKESSGVSTPATYSAKNNGEPKREDWKDDLLKLIREYKSNSESDFSWQTESRLRIREAKILNLVALLLTKAREESTKKAKEVFKNYWYHAGRWHNARCDFLMSDEGVCNCKSGKIRQEINETLTRIREEK